MAVKTIEKKSKYVFGWEEDEKEFTSLQELLDYINDEGAYLKAGHSKFSGRKVRSYLDIVGLVNQINSEGNYNQFTFIMIH